MPKPINSAPAITREEFERAYAERSGLTVEQLASAGRVFVRCWCGYPNCDGWACVSAGAFSDPGGVRHVVQSRLGAKAEAFADEFESKAARARIRLVRRWYERRAREARKIAFSETSAGVR